MKNIYKTAHVAFLLATLALLALLSSCHANPKSISKTSVCTLPSWHVQGTRLSQSQIEEARAVTACLLPPRKEFNSLSKNERREILLWVGSLLGTDFYTNEHEGAFVTFVINASRETDPESTLLEICQSASSSDNLEPFIADMSVSYSNDDFDWAGFKSKLNLSENNRRKEIEELIDSKISSQR